MEVMDEQDWVLEFWIKVMRARWGGGVGGSIKKELIT